MSILGKVAAVLGGLGGLVALAAPVQAAGPVREVPPPACATMNTTVEMVECASWELEQADRWLNQVYTIVRGDLPDDQAKTLLRDAQRAWVAFRDAACAADADEVRGGTMAPLVEIGCRTFQTKQRARDLGARLLGIDPPRFEAEDVGRQLGAFACDGQLTEARLGLSPTGDTGRELEVQLLVGDGAFVWPIDPKAQEAVCGADVSLWVVENPKVPNCPALAVDDGQCDRILVYWDGREFVTRRN